MTGADRARRFIHHALGSGTECVIGLANEVPDAKAYHLLNRQTFALTQRFQPLEFLI